MMQFRREVLDFYRKHGRYHLPWRSPPLQFRQTKAKLNPYRILVSEVMLQQTQVDRVIPFYRKFLKRFPSVQHLASSPLSAVLLEWQGLGYNRRAKMLHEAAKKITIYGNFPREYEKLILLPGVGEYTAKAVRVFAFNEPEVMLETNIRAVFIHHFFSKKSKVPDKKIVSYMIRFGISKNITPREWYAALMDYGAHLKKTHSNPSRKSAHHVKQKPFKGSDREIRGVLLRSATKPPYLQRAVLCRLPFEKERVKEQLAALVKEGMLVKRGRAYRLP